MWVSNSEEPFGLQRKSPVQEDHKVFHPQTMVTRDARFQTVLSSDLIHRDRIYMNAFTFLMKI